MRDFLFDRRSLLALASQLRWVEPRHFLEFVGLASAIKRVIRIPVDPIHEASILQDFALTHSVTMRLSRRKLAVVASNALDEQYVSWVELGDSREGDQVAYLALDTADAEFAALAEDEGDQCTLGILLGYPACCTQSYSQSPHPEAWIQHLLGSVSKSAKGYWQCNRMAYFISGAAVTPDYFPCSLQCAATRELAATYISAMHQAGFSDDVALAEKAMRQALLFHRNQVAQLPACCDSHASISDWMTDNSLRWTDFGHDLGGPRLVEFA
jgi:hypothetical protein